MERGHEGQDDQSHLRDGGSRHRVSSSDAYRGRDLCYSNAQESNMDSKRGSRILRLRSPSRRTYPSCWWCSGVLLGCILLLGESPVSGDTLTIPQFNMNMTFRERQVNRVSRSPATPNMDHHYPYNNTIRVGKYVVSTYPAPPSDRTRRDLSFQARGGATLHTPFSDIVKAFLPPPPNPPDTKNDPGDIW